MTNAGAEKRYRRGALKSNRIKRIQAREALESAVSRLRCSVPPLEGASCSPPLPTAHTTSRSRCFRSEETSLSTANRPSPSHAAPRAAAGARAPSAHVHVALEGLVCGDPEDVVAAGRISVHVNTRTELRAHRTSTWPRLPEFWPSTNSSVSTSCRFMYWSTLTRRPLYSVVPHFRRTRTSFSTLARSATSARHTAVAGRCCETHRLCSIGRGLNGANEVCRSQCSPDGGGRHLTAMTRWIAVFTVSDGGVRRGRGAMRCSARPGSLARLLFWA